MKIELNDDPITQLLLFLFKFIRLALHQPGFLLCEIKCFRADLDPIYYCELIPACPVNDHGDAKFTSFTATPQSGPQGTCTTSITDIVYMVLYMYMH